MGFDIIFDDLEFIEKIKSKLPKYISDLNNASRKGGKISPDIGALREKLIIGILKKQYKEKVKSDYESQEFELDFEFEDERISFKTSVAKGFKLIWTANYNSGFEFYENYTPTCSIVLLLLFQAKLGRLYYFPLNLLHDTRRKLGKKFLKIPNTTGNPRGVELSTEAFNQMMASELCKKIVLDWDNIEEGPSTAVDLVDHYYNLW